MTQERDKVEDRLNVDTGEGSPKSSYSVCVYRSDEEILTLRDLWEKWAVEPTSDIDQFLLVCRTRDNVRNPHVIVVSGDKGPVALLATRLENGKISSSIGYFTPFQFSVRSLSMVYCGLLGHVDDAVVAAVMDSISGTLKTREADVVTLYQMPVDSPLLAAAIRETPYRWRDGKPSLSPHWQLILHDKPGGLRQKMTSKHRSSIRRKARELEEAFPGRISYHNFQVGGDVSGLCAELESVARLTYQRGLGEGFKADADHQNRFELFNRRKALRAWTLRVNDEPRAFCVGFVYRNVFYFSETGYDPEYRTYEIGTLMFLHMTDSLIEERMALFDFGFGDAYYKKRFGDHSWQESTIRLYSPSAKGFLVRWCIGFTDSVFEIGRRLVRRLGFIDRLKKSWRQRLTRKMKKQEA